MEQTKLGKEKGKTSIYEKLGKEEKEREKNLKRIVQKATPILKRVFFTNYRLEIYRKFVKEASDLDELGNLHGREYADSRQFRRWRPHYRTIKKTLETEFGME
ncbi:MAG: hypothetical protein WD876_01945 [Candidatus Pacearchaeota archaeon]